ncbi:hypothetical protein ANTPLA_LOCUS8223 [Anthophora plagiata]
MPVQVIVVVVAVVVVLLTEVADTLEADLVHILVLVTLANVTGTFIVRTLAVQCLPDDVTLETETIPVLLDVWVYSDFLFSQLNNKYIIFFPNMDLLNVYK